MSFMVGAMSVTNRWLLPTLLVACGNRNDDAVNPEVERGLAHLRQMHEIGAAPLNACRSRLQTAMKRVGRGAAAETITIAGPVLCIQESTFVDCTSIWEDRFKDVCGRTGYEQIKSPTSAPGDGKRFLAELATAKTSYDAAVVAAATASPAAVYRERCWWAAETGDFKITYENRQSGEVRSFGTAVCQAELTTLGASLEPIASVTGQATVAATTDGKLEQSAGVIDRANDEARAQAATQARAAMLARIKS